jgi:hypothetical protein
MLQRLLERGKTSGRSDDNEDSIKKRFSAFLFFPLTRVLLKRSSWILPCRNIPRHKSSGSGILQREG